MSASCPGCGNLRIACNCFMEAMEMFARPSGPSIIVVGPDRVGKTTTVKNLAKLTGLPTFKAPAEKKIFKEGGRQSLAFDYTLTHFLSQTGTRFISDRGYPCEWVYAGVFDRDTDWDLLDSIDVQHGNLGTVIVYLWSSIVPTEEDDIVPKDMYWQVVDRYDEFCQRTTCRLVSYDCCDMLLEFEKGGDISSHVASKILDEVYKK